MKTYTAKPNEIKKEWLLIDLKGKVLGRAASQIARILRGKVKPVYTPHVDTGDFVVIINAGEVKLTGKKMSDKIYRSHSGYIGGLKEFTAQELLKRHPEELITRAVKGMLPHTALSKQMMKKLKVYAGAEHPHVAQQPKPYELN